MAEIKLDTEPLERDIENRVCAYAKRKGCWVRKFTSPNNRGVPDRLFIYKRRVFFIEFKRKGRKPTALQTKTIEEMKSHGAEVYVIDNVQAGKELIDAIVAETSGS